MKIAHSTSKASDGRPIISFSHPSHKEVEERRKRREMEVLFEIAKNEKVEKKRQLEVIIAEVSLNPASLNLSGI